MLNNEASREALKKAKRIVIKVGTSTITYANGKRNLVRLIVWRAKSAICRIRARK